MTVRRTAVRMRPAWAVSWRPWCRPPSTASTGLAAASWSSAATSRRSPPPSALCLPHHLPSEHHPTLDTRSSLALLVSSWASRSVEAQDECWILELKARDGCRVDLGGVGAGRDTVTNLCSDRPGPSVHPARWADLSSSLRAVSPQTVWEPALILGHGVNSVMWVNGPYKEATSCVPKAGPGGLALEPRHGNEWKQGHLWGGPFSTATNTEQQAGPCRPS